MRNRNFIVALFVILVILACAFFIPGGDNSEKSDLWKNATYTADTELGRGEKTLFVEVCAEEKSVTFTVHTDKDTVGDALVEHKLISGEEGAYGLYVKVVNGIEADYDKNKHYWELCKDGESLSTGVDSTEFTDGDRFELKYAQ